ncbi:unnamed protein product [Trifolium pratense]|uniref:Uncharacterized protein n=1 Tax=Trifolium pratense TaxID=57577 RepID=A0ACB0KNV5_TRIPR|nr:unnamed protein product [Trifolium pratense]
MLLDVNGCLSLNYMLMVRIVERYKARLVAKDYTQTEGIDYLDTFSPVVKMTTIRTLLAIAAAKQWPLYQLDVNTAFLHGDLNEEVYNMKPPPGLSLPSPNLVCKLQRYLYGLKQASRQWNTKLTDTLTSSGYIQSKSDYSLFTKQRSSGFTVILVYVDDLVLGGTDIDEITHIKTLLDTKFSIKDLGTLKDFLGFEVARTKAGISLCQTKYTLDLIKDAGLLGAKPCNIPMKPQLQLHKSSGEAISDPTTYRRLVGRLLYLTHTRPEIAYTVSKLSQFLAAPTNEHMLAEFHVLKFLKQSPGQGLFFSCDSPLNLKGFSDSDWGACPDTRRSTTGICFFLGSSLISWKSKKQNVVSRSSSEAEYRALAQATCEAQWLMYLLQDFKIAHPSPVVIYCDNKSALHIAANPVFHERTKHIEMDCHVVRDKVQSGLIHLLSVPSKEQVADILTKSLHPGPFNTLQSKLGMLDIFSSLRGDVKTEDNKQLGQFSIQRTSFASRTSSASLQHSQSLRGLSARIEEDIEQVQLDNKKKPKRVSILRLAKLTKLEVPVILLGTIAALVHGVVFPIFGLLFSSAINMFYIPPEQQRKESRFWSLLYVCLGFITLAVLPLQEYFFRIAGGKLIERIRSLTFEKIVHKETKWFDDPANSSYVKMYFNSSQYVLIPSTHETEINESCCSGAMGARLSTDASTVKSLVGDTLALIVQNISTVTAGLMTAFTANWILAFIVLAVSPMVLFQGMVQMKFLKGFSVDAEVMNEEASKVATDVVSSIRIVASFCAESKVMDMYSKKCLGPEKQGGKALVWGFLTMTAIAVSQSTTLAPDTNKAKDSAASLFEILDSKPDIDSSSNEGVTQDTVVGNIELQHVNFNYPTRLHIQIFKDLSLSITSGKVIFWFYKSVY